MTTAGGAEKTAEKPPSVPRAPAARRPPSLGRRLLEPTASGAIGFAFAMWGFWLGIRQLSDNSFYTHLATGRLILENHQIPTVDPYSFTAANEPWVVQSWLASLLYGLIDQWSGGLGLRLFTAVLSAITAWLIWRLTRPANIIARVAVTAMAMIVGVVMWAPRPLLIGLVLMALTLLVAEGGLDARWLTPAFWVWVNSHGSFPLGLIALVVLYAGRRLDKQDGATELRGLKWAALGTVLAVINPLGPKILVFPVELLQKTESLQQIIEWQSPSFIPNWSRIFLLQIVVTILALVRRPSWRGALAMVVFLAAALLGQRNIAIASMVFAVVAAHGLAGLGSLTGKDRSVVFAVAAAALLVALAVGTAGTLDRSHYDLAAYPVDAVAWLDQHEAVGRPDVRLASQDTTGNYLELLYGKDARVFMDDRVDMYPKAVVDGLLTLVRGSTGWVTTLDQHQVDLVLWERGGAMSELMAHAPAWRVVYEDGKYVVACRRGTTVGTIQC